HQPQRETALRPPRAGGEGYQPSHQRGRHERIHQDRLIGCFSPVLARSHSSMPPAPMQTADELTAEELVAQALSGRSECLDTLAGRFRPGLVRFLRGKTRCEEDAEDLAQEALLRAFDRLESYDASYRFSTWLYTIAARLAVNHGRAQK